MKRHILLLPAFLLLALGVRADHQVKPLTWTDLVNHVRMVQQEAQAAYQQALQFQAQGKSPEALRTLLFTAQRLRAVEQLTWSEFERSNYQSAYLRLHTQVRALTETFLQRALLIDDARNTQGLSPLLLSPDMLAMIQAGRDLARIMDQLAEVNLQALSQALRDLPPPPTQTLPIVEYGQIE